MRAAAFTEPGPPDVLRILDVPTPRAGPGEVRVRVRAAGVQPYDAAIPVVYGDGLAERVRDHKPTAVLDGAGGAAYDLSLAQVVDAHREIETEHGRGKLVLTLE